ncbi:uncharacterized protein [Nicotiana tomentosiformis]|uniref:uncharacterized protein n=1 Tax=Nicotiana tomentosiformis TaxID=4098 RepID=UPI00388C80BA
MTQITWSMMPDNLQQEIEQLESQKKPNLKKMEVVNLGSEEEVKETRIIIHLEAEQKEKLVELLRKLRIKEEVTKQIEAKVVRITNYPSWLTNIVPEHKKDEKIRICVDYRDLNKA